MENRLIHHKVLVLNLTLKINADHIKEIFGHYGDINYVDVTKSKYSNHRNPGKAYISFASKKSADDAIKYMNRGIIDGEEITVTQLNSRPRSPQIFQGQRNENPQMKSKFNGKRFQRSRSPPRKRSPQNDIRGRDAVRTQGIKNTRKSVSRTRNGPRRYSRSRSISRDSYRSRYSRSRSRSRDSYRRPYSRRRSISRDSYRSRYSRSRSRS